MEAANERIGEAPYREPDLMDYYYRLRKRKRLVISVLFLVLLVTAVVTFSMKPVYQATATILIDNETHRSPLTGQPLEAETYVSQQLTFRTHFEIITSRPVLERVLATVNLDQHSLEQDFFRRFLTTVNSNLRRLIRSAFHSSDQTEEVIPPQEQLLAQMIRQLRNNIEIREVPDTRLLKICVLNHNPYVARDVANALAETHIQYDSSTRLESSRKILDWMSQELYSMKKKVEDSEKTFLDFKEKENLFSIEGKQKINVSKIEEMNAGYIEARSKRLELEARILELKKFIDDNKDDHIRNVPTFIKSDIVQRLYAELLEAEIEHQNISGVFKRKHPEMIKVTSRIEELRRKIREEIRKALYNAEAERAVLIAREKALQGAMEGYEKEAIGTNRKELQYAILQREMETNREIYNTLLAKIKEADVTGGITKTNLRLVEPASLPTVPIKPKKARNLVLGVVLGLVLGIGLAFFLDYIDQTLHNREEAENYLNLPVLAEIPIEKSKKRPTKYSVPSVLELPLTAHFTEAFRTLATNLSFSQANHHDRVYLVTSSVPEEGKSVTCFNLGLTMARLGRRTLLIEADFRLPTMKKILGLEVEQGLSEVLTDTFSAPVNEGSLGDWAIGDIHKLLEVQEKSGVLTYKNETNVFDVTFLKGQIIFVDWPTRSPEQRLGSLLVQSGKLTKEQALLAMAKQRSTSQRLGQVLLHLGFLNPEELAGPLKLQIQENMRALLNCRHASFTFRDDARLVASLSDPRETALSKAMGPLDGANPCATPFLINQIQQRIIRVENENLWVLPSGRIPSNTAEPLGSSRMRVLFDLLSDQFDLILMDSPPAAILSDAAALASLSDGVIMVIRAGATNFKEMRSALDQLSCVQARVLGVVLNMIDMKKDPYYYGRYTHKYNGYYADGKQA
jgi:succinoglycan biosynthesis transport protein ExoP